MRRTARLDPTVLQISREASRAATWTSRLGLVSRLRKKVLNLSSRFTRTGTGLGRALPRNPVDGLLFAFAWVGICGELDVVFGCVRLTSS